MTDGNRCFDDSFNYRQKTVAKNSRYNKLKMKIIVLSLYIIFLSFTLYAQCDTLRNETHIFWCEEYTLQFGDFQDTSRLAKHLEWCESKSLCWGAYTCLLYTSHNSL